MGAPVTTIQSGRNQRLSVYGDKYKKAFADQTAKEQQEEAARAIREAEAIERTKAFRARMVELSNAMPAQTNQEVRAYRENVIAEAFAKSAREAEQAFGGAALEFKTKKGDAFEGLLNQKAAPVNNLATYAQSNAAYEAAKKYGTEFAAALNKKGQEIDKEVKNMKEAIRKSPKYYNEPVVKQPLDLFAKDASPPGVAGLPWGGGFTTPKRLLVNTATSWGMPGVGIHQYSSPVAEMPVQGFALGMPTVHKFQPSIRS